RTTAQISKVGLELTPADLRSGDLVFFNTLKRKFSHVGIYLGDVQNIHSLAPRVEFWKLFLRIMT
ncbi:MAG: C40 family peptidase, partial [Gallionella sp.]|nr:C40 family peptidase [Gallionella sp.]